MRSLFVAASAVALLLGSASALHPYRTKQPGMPAGLIDMDVLGAPRSVYLVAGGWLGIAVLRSSLPLGTRSYPASQWLQLAVSVVMVHTHAYDWLRSSGP